MCVCDNIVLSVAILNQIPIHFSQETSEVYLVLF